MSGEDSARQTAQGNYNAQAQGEGAQAKVEITQQAPLSPTVAIAPAPPPHFIGRHYILNTLKDVLGDGQAMALQGMGGIGKTATAKKLAAEINPNFPGGVFWGALSDHTGNPHPILRTWGRACGQDLSDETDFNVLANLVRGLLAARRADRGPLMAIVDDVRGEWLDASKFLQQALPADTPLLLTTRDETIAAALGASVVRLDKLSVDEALTLLKVHAGVAVVEAELEAAQALLGTVGYLPLAIEMAGKHLGLLGRKPGYRLDNLRQAIEKHPVETLTLPGYPGLAATFAITYKAQLMEVQRLFRWLGVFAVGPLYLTSVVGVLGWGKAAAEQALDALALTASLAWGEEKGEYTLHPLLRQYAEGLLAEAGEVDEARQRHRVYYLDLVNADDEDWQRIEAAYGQVKWAWASLPEDKIVVDYALALDLYQERRGLWRDQMEWAQRALEVAEAAGMHSEAGEFYNTIGFSYSELGQPRLALDYFHKALGSREQVGDQIAIANALNNIASVYDDLGESDKALEYYRQALAIHEREGNQLYAALTLGNIGTTYGQMDQHDQAFEYYKRALEIQERLKDFTGIANTANNIGKLYYDLDEPQRALGYLQRAAELREETGDRDGFVDSLAFIGRVYRILSQPQQAVEFVQRALDISRDAHNRAVRKTALIAAGEVFIDVGQMDGGLQCYHEARVIAEEIGDLDQLVRVLELLGNSVEDVDEALEYKYQAIQLWKRIAAKTSPGGDENIDQNEELSAQSDRETIADATD